MVIKTSVHILLMFVHFKSVSQLDTICNFDTRCRCDRRYFHVDCSEGHIVNIPNFPSSTRFLSLRLNFIKIITNRTFEKLTNLIELDVSQNRLMRIESAAFAGLSNLQSLILQNNSLEYSFQSFPIHTFKPLISLRYLNIKFNVIDDTYKYHFPSEVMANLNMLESLEFDIISVKTETPFGVGFSNLSHLQNLTAGYGLSFELNNKTFENLQHLRFVDVSRCHIYKYNYGTMSYLTNLTYLDVSHNHVDVNSIWNLMDDLYTSSIKKLLMNDVNRNFGKFPNIVFLSLSNSTIRHLMLRDNNYVTATGDEFLWDELPPTLETLDFSNNKLQEFSYKMPYLMSLILTNNSLGTFLESYKYSRSTTTELKYVDLSNNAIRKLHFSLFSGHSRLKVLNLSGNYMRDLFDISNIQNLRMLDFSRNRFESFNQITMFSLDGLFKKSNLKINLSENTLQCNCGTLKFLQWMILHRKQFCHFNTYTCIFHDESYVLQSNIDQIISQLQKECTSYTALTVIMSVAILGISIFVTSSIVFRFRWKLRYVYYMSINKYRQDKIAKMERIYTYNAFISYDDNDREFILKECIQNLENNEDIRLCLHQRDFLPGVDINVNITNAIHESRKMICVITRSYLDSYYCMFEFNMARMESMYSRGGQNILLLVFLEAIPPRELPLVVLEVIQKQSYIEYTKDEHGNLLFWEKIKEVLA